VKAKKHQQGFVLIPITLLVVFLLGGWLIYKNPNLVNRAKTQEKTTIQAPTTAPTPTLNISDDPNKKNWKSYKDDVAGYQISFPASWDNKGLQGEYNTGLLLTSAEGKIRDGSTLLPNVVELSFGYVQLKDDTYKFIATDFKEAFQRNLGPYPPGKTGGVTTKLGNIKINGQDAIKFLHESSYEGLTYASSYQIKGQTGVAYYRISFGARDKSSLESHQQEIDQIVNSFKIIPLPTPTPVGLKAYTNQEIGLSYQYPSNWTQTGVNLGLPNGRHMMSFDKRFSPGGKDPFISRCEGVYPDDIKNQDTITIGNQILDLKRLCDDKYKITTANGAQLSVFFRFFGYAIEDQAREVLKSVKGLKIEE